MGFISALKVVTRAEYYGQRHILPPGDREWATTIKAICANGYSLPPCVTFKGGVAIVGWLDSLLKDWQFEFSNSDWTNDEIGLRWLQKLFIP